jgi:vacuolar protein sorting-associated protein 26
MIMNPNLSCIKPKSVELQVGVEDCLHIVFHYNNVHLCMDDCLTGYVHIKQLKLNIECMQLQFIRRELIKAGYDHHTQSVNTQILGKYEIMDGLPVSGEQIPIRMHLKRFEKQLNVTQANKQFSIRYYVNLGLIDADGRRYFKTQEIIIFRNK